MRWLYHLTDTPAITGHRVAPDSLAREGFVHCSYAGEVAESARLYFTGAAPVALRIDPRRLDVPIEIADTPRGPMPHVRGSIPADAIREVHGGLEGLPDRVVGHRVAFVAFEGMTLLDLVGVLDPVSRLRTMGLDPEVSTEVIGAGSERAWCGDGAELLVASVRPALDPYDLVVVPGGHATRTLVTNEAVLGWLRTRPPNRWWASVCTGSLVLAALGLLRGRRATTHHTALELLAAHEGVTVCRERVVRDGPVITAAGVTSALDLGLELVTLLAGPAAARRIAIQMELDPPTR